MKTCISSLEKTARVEPRSAGRSSARFPPACPSNRVTSRSESADAVSRGILGRPPEAPRPGPAAAVRRFAFAALLAVALPIQAQAQDQGDPPVGSDSASVLVSNLGQTVSGTVSAFQGYDLAQSFSTGSNPGGYTLDSVELKVGDTPDTPSAVVVEIRTATGPSNARVPGRTLHVLANPASFSLGANSFEAPSGAALASGTTYFVVVRYGRTLDEAGLDFGVEMTATSVEDPGGAPGWRLAYRGHYNTSGWVDALDPLLVRINGSAAPATTNTAPTITGPATFSVDENRREVGAVTATDNEDPLVFALAGGADASQFEIDESTGGLAFATAPDYEHPTDVASADPASDPGDNVYIVTVIVTGGEGDRAMTAEQTLTVTVVDVDESPDAPSAPMVEAAVDPTQLTVSWSPPGNAGRPPITSYDLRYRASGAESFHDGPQDVTVTRTTIPNLSPGTEYFVQVRATNEDGDGPWSPEGTGATNAQDPARPGRPGELAANVLDGAVELSWVAPPAGDAGPILYYQYRVDADDGGRRRWSPDWDAGTRIDAAAIRRTFDGLCNGASHVYELRAVNAAGPGPAARVEAIPRGATRPVLSIAAVTPTVEHGFDPNGNGRYDDDNNVARFTLNRSGDTSGRLCGINLGYLESGQRTTVAFPSGARAITLRHIAIDRDAKNRPECSITFIVEPGVHYTVAGTGRATAYVRGPGEICLTTPSLSVADARVEESANAVLEFTVTLNQVASGPVTVDYSTADGTARAGEDYASRSGTLNFPLGETMMTVAVPVLDDSTNEGEETVRLTLSNPVGARIVDAVAEGTIVNHDPLPKAWLVRFGRTVASQAVDAIGSRIEGGGGSHLRVGGLALDPAGVPAALRTGPRSEAGLGAEFGQGPETEPTDRTRTMTGRELLHGSSFRFGAGGENGAPSWTAWGQVAAQGFDGIADGVSLDGDVTTGFVGADVSRGRWLAGLALSLSDGAGSFGLAEGDRAGRIESRLTSLFPYARLELTDRVDVWGLVGYGDGDLTLIEHRDDHRTTDVVTKTGLEMRMGAIGARGEIVSPAESNAGLSLALKSDAFWVRMESDAVAAPNLEASKGDARRIRLAMEASRAFEVGDEAALTPSVDVGLRHDGGDAETGTGLEVGGSVRYSRRGITVAGAVRTLVAHADSGYEEWGASGLFRIDPGASGRGLSLTVAPVWGAGPGGVTDLWSLASPRSLGTTAPSDPSRTSGAVARLSGALGYGIGLGGTRGVATPYAGLSMEGGGRRTWRTGVQWNAAPAATLGLEGSRGEGSRDRTRGPANAVTLHAALRW